MERLLGDAGLVRNRLKMAAPSLPTRRRSWRCRRSSAASTPIIWQFTGGKTKHNQLHEPVADSRPLTEEAEAMSKDLKGRGFKFVGPTICYAFMQAAGMVNDHTTDCFRHKELLKRKSEA